jgi:hypothetical protein
MPASLLGRGLKPLPKRPAWKRVSTTCSTDRPVEVDSTKAQAGELSEAESGAEQAQHVVPPEQREPGQQPAGLLGRQRAAFGVGEDAVGIHPPLWGGYLADRVGCDGAFVLGKLQDAEQDRAAGHQALVAEGAGELVLPLADERRPDGVQGPLAEPGSDVAS